MSNMKKRILSSCVSILLFTLVIISFVPHYIMAASSSLYNGDFIGYSGDFSISNEELFNETNTFYYLASPSSNGAYYDTSTRNNEVVSRNSPQITVITHGLGGFASDWSNNGAREYNNVKFAYNSSSIIEKLADLALFETNKEADVYLAYFKNHSSFSLYNLDNPNNIDQDNNYTGTESERKIKRADRHIIIVFQCSYNQCGNNEAYEELNYMLSKIMYDVKVLNGGILPRVNMIAHSRGGITNLQYALDHPDLVSQMFSMGTPYFGSDTASTDKGGDIGGNVADIIDRTVYQGYYDRWEKDYSRLYSKLDVYAIGAYSNVDFVINSLCLDPDMLKAEVPWLEPWMLESVKWTIDSYQLAPLIIPDTYHALVVCINIEQSTELADIIVDQFLRYGDFQEGQHEVWMHVLRDLSYFDVNGDAVDNLVAALPIVGSPFLMNDLLVDLPSQLGVDNHSSVERDYGFKKITKRFDDNNCDTSKRANPSMLCVTHSLETQDNDLINSIIDVIDLGDGKEDKGFRYSINSDDTITITNYVGLINRDKTFIPEYIDGYKVTKIGDNAFNNVIKKYWDTILYIPDTITEIGVNALKGCSGINKVVFTSSSQIEVINNEAFSGCSKLAKIEYGTAENVLPNTLKTIGDKAFMSCSFESIKFGDNVSYIGDAVLAKNTMLKNIEVSGKNSCYSSMFGVLYELDPKTYLKKEIVAVAPDNGTTKFSVPASVENIGSYAFAYHKTLNTVYFSTNLLNIDDYAFYHIGFNNNAYTGLKVYTKPNGSVAVLGENVFSDIKNLIIYVSAYDEEEYTDYSDFSEYSDKIRVATIKIYYYIYDKNGNQKLITATIKNGSNVKLREVNPADYGYIGYRLESWKINGIEKKYDSGKYYYIVSDTYSDVSAEAVFVVDTYTISFKDNANNYDIEYGATSYKFAVPTKRGYTFNGWKDSLGNKYTDTNGKGIRAWDKAEDTTLYADWTACSYSVSYNLNGGSLSGTVKRSYTVLDNDYVLPTPTRNGYTFLYWKDQNSSQIKTIYTASSFRNIELTAYWKENIVSYKCSAGRTISDYKAIVTISGSASTSYEFVINSTVSDITFIGSLNYTSFKIIIKDRSQPLGISLNNMKITAPTGYSAIRYDGRTYFSLSMTFEGTNSICGGRGSDSTYTAGTGGNGFAAIDLTNAYISLSRKSGTLEITGGQGGKGGEGSKGTTGANGKDATGLFIANGGDGGDGGKGGTGGTGGKGGVGIKAKTLYIYYSCNSCLTIKGGKGGEGGKGGQGGNGGKGGYGAGSVAISMDGGDGGDGGKGGTGGTGGAGGSALSVESSSYSGYATKINGIQGTGGAGGAGGYGGSGGADGASCFKSGNDGANGARGATGDKGQGS